MIIDAEGLSSIIDAWRAQLRDSKLVVDVSGANLANLRFLSQNELETGRLLAMDTIRELALSETRLYEQMVQIGTTIGLTKTLKQQLRAVEDQVVSDKVRTARMTSQESSAVPGTSGSLKGKERERYSG